jgi:hypothetical protein
MWLGEMDTEIPGSEEGGEEYWMKWMLEVEETGSEGTPVREGRKEGQTDLAR